MRRWLRGWRGVLIVLGVIGIFAAMAPEPSEEERLRRQIARSTAEVKRAYDTGQQERDNARLDAEIQHALKTTGTYIPENTRTIDYRSRALILCTRYAKAAAAHPSTVSFGWGSSVDVHADNSADVTARFRAKNSFGLELDHRIACRVSPDGDVTAQIFEAS